MVTIGRVQSDIERVGKCVVKEFERSIAVFVIRGISVRREEEYTSGRYGTYRSEYSLVKE